MSTFASLLPLLFGIPGAPGIDAGAIDPSVTGRAGAIGSWFIQTDTGDWWRKYGALDTDWELIGTGSGGSLTWFGNGADGDVTLAPGTTTLTRDMYYNNLTVPNGATLDSDGYRVFVKEVLTIEAGGAVHLDGPAGVGSTGGNRGLGTRSTDFGSSGTGGSFGVGVAGGANNDQPIELGAPTCQGGAGGQGFSGAYGGGAGGTVNVGPASDGGCWALPWLMEGAYSVTGDYIPGGSGGGGGGGGPGAGDRGGGGGAGGGFFVVAAETIVNDGRLSANGGNGGDGQGSNSSGGGGGGGGGKIIVITQDYTGTQPEATGGTGGAGLGVGLDGSDGNDGVVVVFEGV